MSQQVQELIEKIKLEGVQAADEKARQIEGQAQSDAQRILTEANVKAKQIIASATAEAQRFQESAKMALKQAARDTLLVLRREIEDMLGKIVNAEIGAALSPEQLAGILTEVVKKSLEAQAAPGDILVTVNPRERKALEDNFLAKLQKQMKNEIRLQSADDIGKGFTISFDGGKSGFDFTDASLAKHISTYLNPRVAALVQEIK